MGLLDRCAKALGIAGATQVRHQPATPAPPAPVATAPLPGGRLMNPVPAKRPDQLYESEEEAAAAAAEEETPELLIQTQRRPGLAFTKWNPPSGPMKAS